MPPLADLSALLALGVLLVVAYTHPPRWLEAVAALGGAGLATGVGLSLGVVQRPELVSTVTTLLPVVAFLVTMLVVAHVCDRAGLFLASSRLLRGSPGRVFTVAFLVAAAVTVTLSLDATVVLLTPVVVATALRNGAPWRIGAYACLRMANSASILLPISNLTNLLALPFLSLTFIGFAATMAPVLAVVLAVEYVGLRLLLGRDLRRDLLPATAGAGAPRPPSAGSAHGSTPPPSVPVVPAVLVGLMLLAFVVTSPLGLEPWWVSATTAVALVTWARGQQIVRLPETVGSAHLEFAALVLALGLVVKVLEDGFLADLVRDAVPDGTTYVALLGIAALATLLANALTNLSAALLLLPVLAPLGDTAVLAALIGLNIGSGLTLGGSLANLLWRRTLIAAGHRRSLAEFHVVSFAVTPVAVTAAVSTLWWVT